MAVALLSPAALPKVLGEAMLPGVRVVALLNRSGLLLGCAGDAASASSIAAICSTQQANQINISRGLGKTSETWQQLEPKWIRIECT